jgi:hypothetical protein
MREKETERDRWKRWFDRYAYQTRHGSELGADRVLDEALSYLPLIAPPEPQPPDDPARPHIVGCQFKSDKYGWCAPGFVALKTSNRISQPHLWAFAQDWRSEDPALADDLEFALRAQGYVPPTDAGPEAGSGIRGTLVPDET